MSKVKYLLMAMLAISIGLSYAQDSEKAIEYTGAEKCAKCHSGKMADKGAEVSSGEAWENGPHAKAFATLGTDEAKAIATEMGIEDPQAAGECLKCHATAYGVDEALMGKMTMEEGVGCESCHGAGGEYYKMGTMKKLTKGEVEAASVGLLTPTEETCVGCHNEESPTYKEFKFDERVVEISHPVMPAEE